MEGDLVFRPNSAAGEDDAVFAEPLAAADEVAGTEDGDEGGEEDPEAKRAKTGPTSLPPVHVVTEEDVKAGTFRLTDVILPMPG